MSRDLTPPDPSIVLELIEAFRCSKVMFAAVSLGVFDRLAKGPRSAETLSHELPANLDALTRLLDACVGLRLLARDGSHYVNTPSAAAYLCSESPRRITGYINFSNEFLWNLWGRLEDAVREGTHRWKQVHGWEGPLFSNFFRTEESKREFLFAMHGQGIISSPQVVSAFDLSRFETLCDLGGATGHLAIAACQRYPGLRAVIFDLAGTNPLAQEIVAASDVAARIEIAAGDFFTDPLPEVQLFALGRILHDWSEPQVIALLQRIYAALPPGGGVLIAEKLLYEDKTGPQWAQLQSLNMLVCTEGKERTITEYESLLSRCGFRDVQAMRTQSPLDALLAIKPL
jgi:acetylserotonin O-methyltransferase